MIDIYEQKLRKDATAKLTDKITNSITTIADNFSSKREVENLRFQLKVIKEEMKWKTWKWK